MWDCTLVIDSQRRKFAEAVFEIYREGDVVWAQDYHLMLLPSMLKKQHPKMKVLPAASPHSRMTACKQGCGVGEFQIQATDRIAWDRLQRLS